MSAAVASPAVGNPTVNPPKVQVRNVNPTDITVLVDENDPKYGVLADRLRANIKRDEEFISLVESMKDEGFTSIVQLIQANDGRLIAVTGRRRRAAAIEAGVPVLARIVPESGITNLAAFVSMIRENEVRKDDDVFNRAEKAAKLREMYLDEYRPKDSEGNPVKDWQPSKTQSGLVTKNVMLTFGFNPKTQTGKYSELLALNNLIEKVKQAVRAGEFTVTQVLGASLHTLTPAKQDAKIEAMLAAKRNKAGVTTESLRGEKTGGAGVSFSKKELLELADARSTPAAVKSWIWYSTNQLNVNQLGEEISWVEKALAEVASKKVAAQFESDQKKIDAEKAKQAKAEAFATKQVEAAKNKAEKDAKKALKAAKKEKIAKKLRAVAEIGVKPSVEVGDVLEIA